jgi:hypothetical protein
MSYLQDRFKRTSISNAPNNIKMYSKWVKVINRVPQGSVLGPLLFIIYIINNLHKILEANSVPILFADDASVLVLHANPLQFKKILNEVYGLLDDWFKKNLLSLNTIKTYC